MKRIIKFFDNLYKFSFKYIHTKILNFMDNPNKYNNENKDQNNLK